MTETKFTPAPWKVREFYNEGLFGSTSTTYDIEIGNDTLRFLSFGNLDTAKANAHLISAAPGMYANEEKNLALLKTMLQCYEDVEKLMMTDKDVKTAIQNEAIKGIMMPDAIHLIIEDLKTRITDTEQLLARARGEQQDA